VAALQLILLSLLFKNIIMYTYILRAIILCLIFFSASFIYANSGILQGSIIQKNGGQPITNAIVILQEGNLAATTNAFGNFSFFDLPQGVFNLEIIHIGYESVFLQAIVNDATATVIAITLNEAPIDLQSVTVTGDVTHRQNTISALDIKLRPTANAQDLLRLVPGLFIAQHAGGGKAEQIFLRGFDIDHGTDISVNVDGIPVNMVSHAHGQGYADLHFVIPETIQSFDFLKGTYSAQFADFATAGAINFNTADYLNNNVVKISAGQFNTLRTLVMLNLPVSNTANTNRAAYIAAEYQISDGPFESPQDFNRTNIFAKYRSMINNKSILSLSASTFSSSWNASGQIPQRAIDEGLIDRFGFIDDKEGGQTSRSNINLELTHIINSNNTITNQIYFTDYKFELYSNFTFFLEDSINGDMIKQKEHRSLYGYNGIFNNESSLLGKQLSSIAGIGFRYDKVRENELSHVAEREILLDRLAYGNVFQTNAFAYLSETLSLTNNLQVNAIIRYDAFNFAYDNLLDSTYNFQSVDDGILTYKLNFDYNLNKNTAFYLYTGKGFHSNDTRVVVAQNAVQTLPAAYGADFGMRFKPYKQLLLQPAIWVLYLEQEFVYVGDAAIVEPGGKTMRRGIDLSARWQLLNWLFIDADINYTLANAIGSPEGENYIPLAAPLTSIGGINVQTQKGWNGSIRYRYMADRPANETGSVIAEGYFINDLVLNYTTKKYELGIEVQNIFNVEWNEAQFDTESRLQDELLPVSELHFTPGVPFFAKATMSVFF